MIEQNGSDPMFGKEKDEDEQDIIELTDEAVRESEAGDDEILELTSEVEEAVGEADGKTDDEDILELTTEIEEAAGETDGEELLELTSEVEETDDEEILELTPDVEKISGEADGEDILELTSEVDEITGEEFVEDTTSELDEIAQEPDMAFDEETPTPEEISAQPDETAPEAIPEISEDEKDLLGLLSDKPEATEEPQPEAVSEEEIPETTPVEVAEFHEPADVDSHMDLPEKDVELASVMGIELDPARDLSLESDTIGDNIEVEGHGKSESGEIPTFIIPKKQLEEAIERAIETKLSKKIDKLLTEAVERAVTTEIGRLKRLLADDLPDD